MLKVILSSGSLFQFVDYVDNFLWRQLFDAFLHKFGDEVKVYPVRVKALFLKVESVEVNFSVMLINLNLSEHALFNSLVKVWDVIFDLIDCLFVAYVFLNGVSDILYLYLFVVSGLFTVDHATHTTYLILFESIVLFLKRLGK